MPKTFTYKSVLLKRQYLTQKSAEMTWFLNSEILTYLLRESKIKLAFTFTNFLAFTDFVSCWIWRKNVSLKNPWNYSLIQIQYADLSEWKYYNRICTSKSCHVYFFNRFVKCFKKLRKSWDQLQIRGIMQAWRFK